MQPYVNTANADWASNLSPPNTETQLLATLENLKVFMLLLLEPMGFQLKLEETAILITKLIR